MAIQEENVASKTENYEYNYSDNLLEVDKSKKTYQIVKRIFDVVCATLALIALSPLFLIIIIAIKLDSKGPAIFKHRRVGKNGTYIDLLKFRTMQENAEAMIDDFDDEQKAEWEENFKLENDPRITRVGKLLRKSSLDELPQLVNIIRGELSVVGPRPVTEIEVERYGENTDKFLSVTPGLTGYWQAYARSDVDFNKRMDMELFYVENANLLWDIKIIFATVGTVLSGKGAK